MERSEFLEALAQRSDELEAIRALAHEIHDSVNQKYDKVHPYWIHLDMAADFTAKYAHSVCPTPDDILPIMFGAYFHDSIEDARLTYRDVLAIAQKHMTEQQALLAAEIVFALTNEKGRTREERANEKYYSGIRSTPFAPLVKMADRLANTFYSAHHSCNGNSTMREVYRRELPKFLNSITNTETDDIRLAIPDNMKEELENI